MDDAELNGALAALRHLPQLGRLLDSPDAAALGDRARVAAALRDVLDEARDALLAAGGAAPAAAALLERARLRLAREDGARLRRVINATGIALHTNLGRAPLAAAAIAAVREVAAGYCDLELDLATGRRGARFAALEARLAQLAGTPSALAVNNCAAAMLLALSALAGGGEVVVSRGELVEIGGGFRIPDVIVQGGARLVEVGTTNRTRLEDYRRAITPATRVLLKVHRSNYRMTGFTAEVDAAALAGLAREHGVLMMHDLGSGAFLPIGDEPTVKMAAAQADLVAFSGDKLLGGPQSGLLVGTQAAIAPLRTHPLLRALRLDKLVAAALEATLALHADPARARQDVPAMRMLHESIDVRQARASRLAGLLGAGEIVTTIGRAGGGTLPDVAIPSVAVALDGGDARAARLRAGTPAVLGRLHDGRLLLDMLAVADEDIAELADAVLAQAS